MKKLLISGGIVISLLLSACNGIGGSGDDVSKQNNGFGVTSINPVENSQLSPEDVFTIGFNNNVDSASLNGIKLINITQKKAEQISCGIIDNTTIKCTPVSKLSLSSKYSLVLSGVHNKAQNPMSDKTINYSVNTQPTIVQYSPSQGNISAGTNQLTFVFSESMNMNTLNNSISPNILSMQDNTTGNNVELLCTAQNNVTMNCNITNPLTQDHSYTLNLTTNIMSATGYSIIPEQYTYTASNIEYNWSILYNLPQSIAGGFYNIQYYNGNIYTCANGSSNTFYLNYNNNSIKTGTINGKLDCRTYNTNDIYYSTYSDKFSWYNLFKFNTTTGIVAQIDNERILNITPSNSGVLYTQCVQGETDIHHMFNCLLGNAHPRIKYYDTININTIADFYSDPTKSQGTPILLNTKLYLLSISPTSFKLGYYQNNNITDITYNFSYTMQSGSIAGFLSLLSKYKEDNGNIYFLLLNMSDAKSIDIFKFNNNEWIKVMSFSISTIPQANLVNIINTIIIKNDMVYYTDGSKLYKYSLISSTTTDITPNVSYMSGINSVAVDDNNTIYVAAGQQIIIGKLN